MPEGCNPRLRRREMTDYPEGESQSANGDDIQQAVMLRVRKRNWTWQSRRLSKADAFVVSVPKSGRTWLRVFLYAYFCRSTNREFTIRYRKLAGLGVSKIEFTHDLWAYVVARRWRYWVLGKGVSYRGARAGLSRFSCLSGIPGTWLCPSIFTSRGGARTGAICRN